MTVTYTGRHVELTPDQNKKLQLEFDKIAKLLDAGRGEKAVHVRISHERHLHVAEVTLAYYGHDLVGLSSEEEILPALHSAVGKLEKQVIRARDKWRDGMREPLKETAQSSGLLLKKHIGEERAS